MISVKKISNVGTISKINLPLRTVITILIIDFGMESQIRWPVWRIFGNWQLLFCLRCGRTDDIVRSGM